MMEKTLESPLDFPILKEISPEYSLEGLMLKLKLQYFGHLRWRTDSLETTLKLGKIEGREEGDDRGWAGWMASLTQWTWVWVSSGSWWRTGKPGMLQSMESQRVRHDWETELKCYFVFLDLFNCSIRYWLGCCIHQVFLLNYLFLPLILAVWHFFLSGNNRFLRFSVSEDVPVCLWIMFSMVIQF